ncbi:MAG: hypothetical protein PVF45_00755 [Anaerolineae bacterium]|jgi:hypothetical protein
MGRISKIRLGKNETIENAVLLGTSQNWYDHIIVVACSKYGVDPTKIKNMYLAAKKLSDMQGERPDAANVNTARATDQVANAAALKKHNIVGGGMQEPEVVANQITEKYGVFGWVDPADGPQNSRPPQKRGCVAEDVYAPLVFSRYVALADHRKDKGDIGSLQAPYLVAVFADKAKKRTDREAFVIMSQVEGKHEVYDNLDAVKKRLYGEKAGDKELMLLIPERYIVLGHKHRTTREIGSLDSPYQIVVFKDQGDTGKRVYTIISKVKCPGGKTKEHGNFGESCDDLDAVKRVLYGTKIARNKELLWGEGWSLEQAKQNLAKAINVRYGSGMKTLPILSSNSSARRTGRATSNSK